MIETGHNYVNGDSKTA